jgi:acyl carrier protein
MYMDRQDALQLIVDTVLQLTPNRPPAFTVDENTKLVGQKSVLDSIALVALIAEIEQQIDDRYGIAMTIADDRALSQERSPFRTVSSLAEYVVRSYNELVGNVCA